VAPVSGSDMLPGLAGLQIPLVVLSDLPAPELRIPSVDVDNVRGGRLATEHLLELGHRRIAHVMGDANQSSAPARCRGFREAMRAAGASVPEEYVVATRYASACGREAARTLLALPQPPTAVFAGNDTLALAILETAREFHVRVPE